MSDHSTDTPTDPPRDYDGLKALIITRRPAMPRRLAQVAEHALRYPDDVAFGTAASIADQASVQPSTLVRFAKALGFSGFSDLQEVFQDRLRDRWPDYRDRMAALKDRGTARSGPAGLLDGFADAGITSLIQLRDRISSESLVEAVDMLASARLIYLLGQRRAFPIAAYFSYAFGKLGIASMLIDNVGSLGAEQAMHASPGDVLLSISFTPYTPLTVELTSRAHQAGIPVLALTDSPFSPLAPLSSCWIELAEADYGAFRSLSASVTVAMALTVATAERRGEN